MKPENNSVKEALTRAGVNTPRSAVDALIEHYLGPNASLLGRRGPKRPSRKSPDPKEREEAHANTKRNRHSKSLNQIAETLHCEGFNEFSAFGVLHYARTRLWGQDWAEEAEARRFKMGNALKDLDPEQRKAIGQFVHYQSEASFQAGLRIGLMASLWTLALSQDLQKPK